MGNPVSAKLHPFILPKCTYAACSSDCSITIAYCRLRESGHTRANDTHNPICLTQVLSVGSHLTNAEMLPRFSLNTSLEGVLPWNDLGGTNLTDGQHIWTVIDYCTSAPHSYTHPENAALYTSNAITCSLIYKIDSQIKRMQHALVANWIRVGRGCFHSAPQHTHAACSGTILSHTVQC